MAEDRTLVLGTVPSGTTEAVRAILERIRAARATGSRLVSFDVSGGPPGAISSIIQGLLIERGYVCLVLLSSAPTGRLERIFIDMSRRRVVRPRAQLPSGLEPG